jgi:hypothetical protein
MNNLDNLDQDKFIVINRKRFDELPLDTSYFQLNSAAVKLECAITKFSKDYEEMTGKKMDQRYIVCNQDEPYADEVARVILEGEAVKEKI